MRNVIAGTMIVACIIMLSIILNKVDKNSGNSGVKSVPKMSQNAPGISENECVSFCQSNNPKMNPSRCLEMCQRYGGLNLYTLPSKIEYVNVEPEQQRTAEECRNSRVHSSRNGPDPYQIDCEEGLTQYVEHFNK